MKMIQAVFIDTNVFFDYSDFDKIGWRKDVFTKASRVILILSPVNHRELSKQKDAGGNNEMRGRASSIIRLMKNLLKQAVDRCVTIADGVEVYFEFRDVVVEPPFNPFMGDDQLISSMLLYRKEHPDIPIALLTHDTNLMIKCMSQGIEYAELPDRYQLPRPMDARDKQIRELKNEIAQLRDDQPKIAVTFTNGEEAIQVELEQPDVAPDEGAPLATILNYFNQRNESFLIEPIPVGGTELQFRVQNDGTVQAANVVVFINPPEGCRVLMRRKNLLLNPLERNTVVPWVGNYVTLRASNIVHGLGFVSEYVVFIFDGAGEYEITWKARAGNMTESPEGILKILAT